MPIFENISFVQNSLRRDIIDRTNPNILPQMMENSNCRFAIYCEGLLFFEIINERIIAPKTYSKLQIAEFIDNNTLLIAAGNDANNYPIIFANIAPSFKEKFESQMAGQFQSLRTALWFTNIVESEIFGLGGSLFSWHKNHQYCANCGHLTEFADLGFRRICPSCNAEHFPRVDPVVIMLVLKDDKCLIGRSKMFPPGLYSILAGFMEPCETIDAACRREVFEETGIEIDRVEYVANQPWPFASQLMIGLCAYAKNSEIVINENELEDALWVDKEQLRHLLSKDGLVINGEMAFGPRPSAIANGLLNHWLANPISMQGV